MVEDKPIRDALRFAMGWADESQHGGQGYFVKIRMASGDIIEGEIQAVNECCVIVMEHTTAQRTPESPVYIDRQKIESVAVRWS